MPFDGAFQMTCAVLQVRTFAEQELLGVRRTSENELFVGLRRHDPVLDVVQFDIQDLAEMVLAKRLENDNLINTIHEFRRKLLFRHIRRGVIQLPIDFLKIRLVLPDAGGESDSAAQHFAHFNRAKI